MRGNLIDIGELFLERILKTLDSLVVIGVLVRFQAVLDQFFTRHRGFYHCRRRRATGPAQLRFGSCQTIYRTPDWMPGFGWGQVKLRVERDYFLELLLAIGFSATQAMDKCHMFSGVYLLRSGEQPAVQR